MAEHPERHHRQIRSFVRRAGRLTASQERALEELWPGYGVEYAPGALDFETLFGRSAPVVLEIGFGNGDTLVEMAAARPDQDFLGIEVHEPGVGHCLIKADKAGVSNLKLVVHDAIEVLENQVASGSLSRINLYFPDPWPKKRHHKRRLIQPAFVELLVSRLAAGGRLHLATDWEDYAQQMLAVLEAQVGLENLTGPGRFAGRPASRPLTKFEARGRRLGHRRVHRHQPRRR